MKNSTHCSAMDIMYSRQLYSTNIEFKMLTAKFYDLLIGKFCAVMVFVGQVSTSALGDHISGIITIRAKPKVGRIHAGTIGSVTNGISFVARMTHKHPWRDWAKVQFPGNTMSLTNSTVNAEPPVPLLVYYGLPKPARIWASAAINLLKESFRKRAAQVVMINIPHRLTSDVSMMSVGRISDFRSLTASAHAKTGRIGTVGDDGFDSVMSMDESVSRLCNRFTASAFAEFNRGFVRGMIAHVSRSFQRVTVPRDVSASPGLCIGFSCVSIAHLGDSE